MPRELEVFALAFLRRPPAGPEFTDEQLDQLQDEHLAYLDRLRRQGVLTFNGPVLDQPDPSLRGISVFRGLTLDQARELSNQDPMVRAGRLVIEMMTFCTQPDVIGGPGTPVTISV